MFVTIVPANVPSRSKRKVIPVNRNESIYLLTEMNPFKEIGIRVKFFKNIQCKAMHQSFPTDIGKHETICKNINLLHKNLVFYSCRVV